MKLFITILFAAVVIAGCSKNDAVNPQNGKGTTNTGGGGTTVKPDSTIKLSHDDSIHLATFKVNTQQVKTSVTGTNLTLKFNENVDLLFTVAGYQKTSAVHLIEDFKNTMLYGYSFTTVAEGGNTTLNWVDDNLNNVILKTVSDTLVNNVKMVKINVHRPFTFLRTYSTNQAALDQQTLFIQKKDDTISFKSYSYYNQKNYLPTTTAARLIYIK